MTNSLHTLQNEFWQVGILPETGASVAFGRVKHSTDWLDVMRPTPVEDYDNSSNSASFVMIPWSNRLRDARFQYDGQTHQLEINQSGEGLAIHGDVRQRVWKVARSDKKRLDLTFDSRDYADVNFPFAFSAKANYWLDEHNFYMELALKNEDAQPFPAGFGHHPYFVRPEGSMGVLVEIDCDKYYEMTAHMPDAAAVAVTDEVDFRNLRSLPETGFDELLTGRHTELTGRIIYPAWNTQIEMVSDPIYEHTILYCPKDQPFFALEPATNANDGFNLLAKGVEGHGVFVLQPGEEKSGVIRLDYQMT